MDCKLHCTGTQNYMTTLSYSIGQKLLLNLIASFLNNCNQTFQPKFYPTVRVILFIIIHIGNVQSVFCPLSYPLRSLHIFEVDRDFCIIFFIKLECAKIQ